MSDPGQANKGSGAGKPAAKSAGARPTKRQGGLGRGLAALIPTGPTGPRMGSAATDVMFGAANRQAEPESQSANAPVPTPPTVTDPRGGR